MVAYVDRWMCGVLLLLVGMVGSAALRAAPPIELEPELRARCIGVLREGMAADDFWPSIHAAEGLTAAGLAAEVRNRLLPKLRAEGDDQHRCGLARELVRAGDRRFAQVMLKILDDPRSTGRTHACESLYKVGEIGDGRALRQAMREGPMAQRLMAAAALGRWGSPEAMALLRRSVTHDDPEVVRVAVWVLGRIGSAKDRPALEQARRKASTPLLKSYITNALAMLGDADARERLRRNLSSENGAVRTYAATFAGELRDSACRAPLVKLLDDPVLDVRIRAAHSLIQLSHSKPADPTAEIRRDVYRPSKEYPRWSEGSIVELSDGRLLYATTRFAGSASDFARADIVARESPDGGQTWGELRVIQPNVARRNVMSVTLRYLGDPLDRQSRLGLFYLVKNGHDDLQVWLRRSRDDGTTFGDPIRVTRTPGYHVMNNDRVVRLADGRLIAPVASTRHVGKENHFRATCWISDDAGATWHRSKRLLDYARRGAMEPGVVEREDGTLLMIARTQLGHIAVSRSQDRGETWSPLESWNVVSPESPATLGVIPSTGDLLLIWNDRYDAAAGHGGRRTPLVAAVSRDGGRSWLPKVVLERDAARTYAYTSLTFVRGRAVMSYYVGEASGRIGSRFLSLPIARFYASLPPSEAKSGHEDGPRREDSSKQDGTSRSEGKREARQPTNRLAKETSPYLLMHAHNPVDWYPWGPEAFAKAKREGKLVFLSIGYSSCHWCHVMERESFTDREIAEQLNKDFVCIKVDREERPDVDTIYMTALQVMGRPGGWPLSVFLTPEGKPFFGFTYLPARDGDRPGVTGFLTVIQKIEQLWSTRKQAILFDADQLASRIKRELEHQGRPPERRWVVADVDRVVTALQRRHDPQWGGFGYSAGAPERPKFPREPALMLLLDRIEALPASSPRRKELLAILQQTLDHMARGGIRDHIGGGFHRYSVDRYWRIPHFEKMLYNQGQLASVYARAYQLTGKAMYRRVVEELVAFVRREMRDEGGGFYAALDAYSDGEEGKFYRWTEAELREVLGKDEFALVRQVYGVQGEPNFEGKYYVLQRSRPLVPCAESLQLDLATLQTRLETVRKTLRSVRGRRQRPLTDTKILTAWNGLMIRGLADAGRILERPEYLAMARRAADFLWEHVRDREGRLLRSYAAGQAKLDAYLSDYAMLIDGLLALHRATGETRWLKRADQLMQDQIRYYGDSKRGGFFFTPSDHEALLARMRDPTDNAWPSGDGLSVLNLLELSRHGHETEYRRQAEQTLAVAADYIRQLPTAVPTTARGVLRFVASTPAAKPPAAHQ